MGHRKPEPVCLGDQIELQPTRDAERQRGDDDLVERAEVDRVMDRHQWLGVADRAGHLASGRLAQAWQRFSEHPLGLGSAGILRIDHLVHPVRLLWHYEMKADRPLPSALGY